MVGSNDEPKLLLTALKPFYDFVIPLSWFVVRAAAGWNLLVHSWARLRSGPRPDRKGLRRYWLHASAPVVLGRIHRNSGRHRANPWIVHAVFCRRCRDDQGPVGDGSGDDLPRAREVSSEKLATCHCQRRNLPHVIIGKAPAWLQHCADTFQKNRAALDRHSVRSGHDDFKLAVGQGNHVPDDNPEKTFCGKHRPGKFQGAVAKA